MYSPAMRRASGHLDGYRRKSSGSLTQGRLLTQIYTIANFGAVKSTCLIRFSSLLA